MLTQAPLPTTQASLTANQAPLHTIRAPLLATQAVARRRRR